MKRLEIIDFFFVGLDDEIVSHDKNIIELLLSFMVYRLIYSYLIRFNLFPLLFILWNVNKDLSSGLRKTKIVQEFSAFF